MDMFRHKSKKDKPMKHVDKDKVLPSTSLADDKSIKEYFKINEMLRNVKINSSMRIKAPRESGVIQNDDIHSDDDTIQNCISTQESDATAETLNENNIEQENRVIIIDNCKTKYDTITDVNCDKNAEDHTQISNNTDEDQPHDDTCNDKISNEVLNKVMRDSLQMPVVMRRDRKLSLDHTMLTRLEGMSQSELDLNSLGKSPLERKSSFFKKKMDSFLKNTSEVFKRRSFTSKIDKVERRNSMSTSMQSLNEESSLCRPEPMKPTRQSYNNQGSGTSLNTTSTLGRSHSSLLTNRIYNPQQSIEDLAASQPVLPSSQLVEVSSDSVYSLNEACLQHSSLSSRAISMSSGLDSANGSRKRTNSRSNRVSWLASEGLTNYFRRIIQDEKKDSQLYYSNQEIPSISENGPVVTSKGRRLSYQRAVSGEDPVRGRDQKKKKPIAETEELTELLIQFTRNGIPKLSGYSPLAISTQALSYLNLASNLRSSVFFAELFDWKVLSTQEHCRQSVIMEIISTEANYINDLTAVVEVFLSGIHALQLQGRLLYVNSELLFINLPDILNANLLFWEKAMFPVLEQSRKNATPFDIEYLHGEFMLFREYFRPYETFVERQMNAVGYLQTLHSHADFGVFLSWCNSQNTCKRLALLDFLVKPMQRLTRYSLLLERLLAYTKSDPENLRVTANIKIVKRYVRDLNRTLNKTQALSKMRHLHLNIDSYVTRIKDEELLRLYKMHSSNNLIGPMVNCAPNHKRFLIHQGPLRFRDVGREASHLVDVEVFLCTDVLLVCRKQVRGNPYKLLRPKYLLNRMIATPLYKPRCKEPFAMQFIMLDELNTAYSGFWLTDAAPKEPRDFSIPNLQQWINKFKEAKLCYDLCVFITKYPDSDQAKFDPEQTGTGSSKSNLKMSDDLVIERLAREHISIMLHKNPTQRCTGNQYQQPNMVSDSFEVDEEKGIIFSIKPNLPGARFVTRRSSSGESSKTSTRMSSLQKSDSTDELAPPDSLTTVSSLAIPSQKTDEGLPSITVSYSSDIDSLGGSVPPSPSPGPYVWSTKIYDTRPPLRSFRQQEGVRRSSLERRPLGRGTLQFIPRLSYNMNPPEQPCYPSGDYYMQVEESTASSANSLPDLSVHPTPVSDEGQRTKDDVSDKIFQTQHELLARNRLRAAKARQNLTSDHRGISFPPSFRSRPPLQRGFAFSHSSMNMPHASCQVPEEAGPSSTQQAKVHTGKEHTVTFSSDTKESEDKGNDKKDKNKRNGKENEKQEDPEGTTKEDDISKAEKQKDKSEEVKIYPIKVEYYDKTKEDEITVYEEPIEICPTTDEEDRTDGFSTVIKVESYRTTGGCSSRAPVRS